ncbi:MAG: hypothetical protein K9M45_01180 [Kiritimatiellales bacterium]|nr:hypothetical protein [Kiritimatiellales bacterium]
MRELRNRTVIAGMAAVLMMGVGIAKADVSVTADFASAYVFRGVTFNDGAVFQPGVEVSGFPIPEAFGAFTVGAWGNYDIEDYDGNLNGSEFSELDLYASYALPIKFVDLSVGYTDYTYPNGGPADKEVSAAIGKEFAGFEAGAAAYFGTGGSIKKSEYYEFSLGYGLDITDALGLSIGGTVAYLDPDGPSGSGWHNATATAGVSYALTENWGISASVTYVGQLNDKVLTDVAYVPGTDTIAAFGYDTEFYGTAGVSCEF